MPAQLDREYLRYGFLRVLRRMLSYLMEGRPLTTRGRWFNKILFLFYRIIRIIPVGDGKINSPVFIVGTGRSGTTILGKVLSIHKDIGFLNEPKAMWHSVFPNEDVSGNFSRKESHFRLTGKDASNKTIRSARRLFGFYKAITCSRLIVDKFPEMIFRVEFIKRIFPDAKFILLVRNGWDVSLSIETWSQKYGKVSRGNVTDWWGTNNRKWILMVDQLIRGSTDLGPVYQQLEKIQTQRDRAAVEWVVTMREGLTKKSMFPDDVIIVKFEDLVNNPNENITNILKFSGLGTDEKVFQYAEKIFRPVTRKERFNMHEVISPHFSEVMKELGYD